MGWVRLEISPPKEVCWVGLKDIANLTQTDTCTFLIAFRFIPKITSFITNFRGDASRTQILYALVPVARLHFC